MGWRPGVTYRLDWCAIQVNEQRIDARYVGFFPAAPVRFIYGDEDACPLIVELFEGGTVVI